MKFSRNIVMAALAVSLTIPCVPSFAADQVKVLVIDSGSDFTHEALKPLALPRDQEFNGKPGVDDDKNGYVDDIFGWNFVDNSATLVNLSDTPPDYDTVLRCMELLGKLQAYGKEGMTPEEYKYLVDHYKDKEFWAWVGFTGGWAHGTHCAGIVSTNNNGVHLNAIKHIQTGASPKEETAQAFTALKHAMAHKSSVRRRVPEAAPTKVTIEELDQYFTQLGNDNAKKIKAKADYIASLQPRLINCSFGTENKNLCEMMKGNMAQWGYENPTDEQVQEIVNLFVTKAFLPRDKAFFSGCKDALVFIAAGNSTEDLNIMVTSPNDVDIANKMVIAATDEDQKIAPFSCYGNKKVDVAVPGVNIFATYPNQKMGFMSGTSMACPNALRMASMVLAAKDDLKPAELKKILMETVDKKDWLKEKVKSGGVINVSRAVFAAQQMVAGKTLEEAVKIALEKVGDKVSRPAKRTRPDLKDPMVKELYFSVIK
ncbi:MAG TPA: S8 family serine peptidase [Candidatus Rifleibacterium sp.]|nr:S8 family serine peptidase [Candidatus Rifleibacterium sp.]HPT44816.1 S8 family serine peptidase [Candidatus Rifleibacterium sp.]